MYEVLLQVLAVFQGVLSAFRPKQLTPWCLPLAHCDHKLVAPRLQSPSAQTGCLLELVPPLHGPSCSQLEKVDRHN